MLIFYTPFRLCIPHRDLILAFTETLSLQQQSRAYPFWFLRTSCGPGAFVHLYTTFNYKLKLEENGAKSDQG